MQLSPFCLFHALLALKTSQFGSFSLKIFLWWFLSLSFVYLIHSFSGLNVKFLVDGQYLTIFANVHRKLIQALFYCQRWPVVTIIQMLDSCMFPWGKVHPIQQLISSGLLEALYLLHCSFINASDFKVVKKFKMYF